MLIQRDKPGSAPGGYEWTEPGQVLEVPDGIGHQLAVIEGHREIPADVETPQVEHRQQGEGGQQPEPFSTVHTTGEPDDGHEGSDVSSDVIDDEQTGPDENAETGPDTASANGVGLEPGAATAPEPNGSTAATATTPPKNTGTAKKAPAAKKST